jgi:hypothetical protein
MTNDLACFRPGGSPLDLLGGSLSSDFFEAVLKPGKDTAVVRLEQAASAGESEIK